MIPPLETDLIAPAIHSNRCDGICEVDVSVERTDRRIHTHRFVPKLEHSSSEGIMLGVAGEDTENCSRILLKVSPSDDANCFDSLKKN